MTVALRSLPQAFLIKKEEKNTFADWLIELENRGFGMSTDAFLKSVKKFLDKEVSVMPLNNRSRSPPYPSHLLFHNARLYFWNRLPDYAASKREACKSLACRNLCTITLFNCCVRILGNIGALQKY